MGVQEPEFDHLLAILQGPASQDGRGEVVGESSGAP